MTRYGHGLHERLAAIEMNGTEATMGRENGELCEAYESAIEAKVEDNTLMADGKAPIRRRTALLGHGGKISAGARKRKKLAPSSSATRSRWTYAPRLKHLKPQWQEEVRSSSYRNRFCSMYATECANELLRLPLMRHRRRKSRRASERNKATCRCLVFDHQTRRGMCRGSV